MWSQSTSSLCFILKEQQKVVSFMPLMWSFFLCCYIFTLAFPESNVFSVLLLKYKQWFQIRCLSWFALALCYEFYLQLCFTFSTQVELQCHDTRPRCVQIQNRPQSSSFQPIFCFSASSQTQWTDQSQSHDSILFTRSFRDISVIGFELLTTE